MKPIIYVAHPVTGNPKGNAQSAIEWVKLFVEYDPSRIYIAPWVPEVIGFLGEQLDPEFYQRVLDDDIEVVQRCNGLIGVGPKWSGGMLQERAAAKARGLMIVDATKLPRMEVTRVLLDRLWESAADALRGSYVEPY